MTQPTQALSKAIARQQPSPKQATRTSGGGGVGLAVVPVLSVGFVAVAPSLLSSFFAIKPALAVAA
ncbi:MAG TPA: hypothetical protein VMV44_12310, partial [Rectinemataceae bacterium]|nr:hypothetical protein [Rectinemataceae bacterium]